MTILLVSCWGGNSSGSSGRSVTVKLNISQDNFRSAPTSRVSINGSEIASLLLTVSGNASYICESLTGETLSSATAFSGSSTHLYVNMTPADYSIIKNCVFDLTYNNETLTYNNETLTFISGEYNLASELNQYNSVSEFVTAVGDIINLTSVLNDNPNYQVTWDLTMPSSVYGVPVSWVVLDAYGMTSGAVSQDGEITRGFPAFGNTYAQITGTMQLGNETINLGPYEIYVLSQDGIEVNANVGLGGLGYSVPVGEYQVYKYSYDSDSEEYNTLVKAMYSIQLLGDLNEANYEESGNFTFYGNYTEDADTDTLYLVAVYGGFVPDEQFDGLATVAGTVPNETGGYERIRTPCL